MIITRTCEDNDKEAMKKLWTELFRDSRNFTDWLFENRFLPEYCACAYDDDTLVSCMHSIPMPLQIRGKEIPSVMISGVSTIEAYRKQGLMHKTFLHFMNEMHSKGIFVTSLKAVSLPVYYSLNHYGCTESAFIRSRKNEKYTLPASLSDDMKTEYECRKIDLNEYIHDLSVCYSDFIKNYSAIAIRSLYSFKLKMDDYLSDDALAVAVFRHGRICAYCIYFEKDSISAEEFIANDMSSACMMYEALKEKNKDITIKASIDTAKWITGASMDIREQNSMGIVNVSRLLKTVCGNRDYSVKVTDGFFKENEGVYLFDGQRTDSNYHLEIASGQLIRLITGYMALEELVSLENVKILDMSACKEISGMLPKLKCFIVDEY